MGKEGEYNPVFFEVDRTATVNNIFCFRIFFESTHEIAKDESAGIKKGVEQCARVVGAALILFLCGDG